jgi:hypothetical protein
LACWLASCSGGGSSSGSGPAPIAATAESCMRCHNGSLHDDYAGSGLENPHPFAGAATLKCTECHGGDGEAEAIDKAHVPPPPEIGDRKKQKDDPRAYFNRLTLAGMDKFPDYVVDGVTYTSIDYLQFVNPGDLRVVTQNRSCGKCHALHAEGVARSPLATETGILGGAMFTLGVENAVPANQGLYHNTASDKSFRAVDDPAFVYDPAKVGAVGELVEFPVFSVHGANGPLDIFNNPAYDAANLPNSVQPDNSVATDSPLANLFHEQIAFTCGDCHLGSAGANNRYGDFRSSGCTACHMRYSQDGRANKKYAKINKREPRDPDDIDEPERPHVKRHLIASIAKTLNTGEAVQGIDDYTCAGCHQGSNRTVMQYWGIRLDQNADVPRHRQYPANPDSFRTTHDDTRLFDPKVRNRTFNGRNPNQYILFEDYDGDGRDDTPADVHYEAGLGCIDCHGSHDLHGGVVGGNNNPIYSHMEQAVAIRCESCHGTVDAYAASQPGLAYDGRNVELAMDAEGNVLKHVVKEGDGDFFLTSRLTGRRHYIKQTRDVVVDNGKLHPFTSQPLYSAKASYAMGRIDNDPSNGIGPRQTGGGSSGFAHGDEMSCVSCHAAWTNNCIGCHLGGEYDTGNNFSNITGERIVFKQANADFTYQTPVMFQLGIDTHNKIAPISPNTEVFFKWQDRNGEFSKVFSFTDRNGYGNNSSQTVHPSLSHNVIMPHSIRGKVNPTDEGPRYCVACHLTTDALDAHGPAYEVFRNALATNTFTDLQFTELQTHIGSNTGNQLNSPYWVHMVAGLGSGLFLFDEDGCPVNPLDANDDRIGCNLVAPATKYDLLRVRLNLDRIVESDGSVNGSNNHCMLEPGQGTPKRDGAANPELAGPMGATLIQKLTDPFNGIVLDSWLDADGAPQGDAATHLGPP